MDENEELRERLGLDKRKPLSMTFKHAKKVQRETERALNVILQKEVLKFAYMLEYFCTSDKVNYFDQIERLEDERVELKLQMRKLAHRLGEK